MRSTPDLHTNADERAIRTRRYIMPKLPKPAIDRLQAGLPAPGAPFEPGDFQGSEHPDANLLSAFAEKSLTARERTEVLNHLAQCADCREVMALAVGSSPAAIPALRPAASWRWTPWPVLRWAALAAAMGAVAIVILLRPMGKENPGSLAHGLHPTIVANAHQPAPPEAPELNPEAGLGRPETPSQNAERFSMKARALPGRTLPDRRASSDRSESADSGPSPPMLTTRPAESFPNPIPSESAQHNAAKTAGENAGSATPAAPPLLSPPPRMAATAEQEANPELSKEAPPERSALKRGAAEAARKGAVSGREGRVSAMIAPAAPPPIAERPEPEVADQLRMSGGLMRMGDQGPAAAQWSISPSGNVRRSQDGHKTWEDVKIAGGVNFRAITAAGGDVWAGGLAGALYHSTDGGATWSRIGISAGGRTVAEAIVGIQAPSRRHVIVTLASGQQWITEDGGRRWRAQP